MARGLVWLERWAKVLAITVAATGVVIAAEADPRPAAAVVLRPIDDVVDYTRVYGDAITVGNGSSTCPGPTAPTDPLGEPKATCAAAQARTSGSATAVNDSYYMQWTDVDADPDTFNSSSATITIPAGADIQYAHLSWAGDTGAFRQADGTVATAPACDARQFLPGAGSAVVPPGTPESTSVRLTVGDGPTTAVTPRVISRDSVADVPLSEPQYFTAYANVGSRLATAPTGSPLTITVGNVWTPEGFGCFSGWALTVIYSFPGPNPAAPVLRDIKLGDGHVRMSPADPRTDSFFSATPSAAGPAKISVIGYDGDFGHAGDSLFINGVAQAEPGGAGATNFWVSDADGAAAPAVANNMSVDAKTWTTSNLLLGGSSIRVGMETAADGFLAQTVVTSVPVPSIHIEVSQSPGPYRPGQEVEIRVVVTSPATPAIGVDVTVPELPGCERQDLALEAGVPEEWTCTMSAPAEDGYWLVFVRGQTPRGEVLDHNHFVQFDVINPAIDITKTADQASYGPGETVTFTVGVENTGDAALTDVVVVDPKVPGCDSTTPTLAPGASFSGTCTAIAPIAGDSNTATVTATDPLGATVTDSATAAAPTVGSISGRVVSDRDGDGVYEAVDGDSGIGGVTIGLDGPGGPRTTTTSSEGTFAFADVAAGTYTLTETQPAGFADGIDTPGSNAGVAGPDTMTVALAAAGDSSTDTTFAEVPTSSIAGRVYEDVDGDGTADSGEDGIGGVTVTLSGRDADGHPIDLTTATAPDGTYSFTRLRAGSYQLVETQPGGYLDGAAAAGSAGGTPTAPDSITSIPLPASTDATGYTFGEAVGASISGTVTEQTGGGIAGVTVTLTGPGGPRTTTTDGFGAWAFSDLAPGTYAVTETQPVGYGDGPETVGDAGGDAAADDVISAITIGSGTTATGYRFEERSGSLSGLVFDDADGDGTHDTGDGGIAGVTVTLTGTDVAGGPVSRSETTDAGGAYTFAGLRAGSYTVTETQPPTYLDGDDSAGTAGGTPVDPDAVSGVTLDADEDATGYLFAEVRASVLSGTVVDDGGEGIADVTVALSGTTGTGDPVAAITTTGPTGGWSFTGLYPGTYTVTETQPAGYGDGPDTAGTAGGTAGDDVISSIVLASGTAATGSTFSEDRGSLAGTVFVDHDDDGAIDSDEAGIAGVVVTLAGTDARGVAVSRTATSGADGAYVLDGLVGGAYALTEAQPASYADGTDTPGTAGGTATPPDSITAITLGAGQDATGYTFAEQAGGIGGTVFVDTDGDGAIDPDETERLEGVAITLLSGATELATTTTASDGTYAFAGLAAGPYTVREAQPPGYGSTTPDEVAVVLTAGGAPSADFGEQRGSIGDTVFADDDGDGVQDPGEAGIPGVTVTLHGGADPDGAAIATATTDADGRYRFGDLAPGTYVIGVDGGPERVPTTPSQGDDPTLDSDVDQATGRSGPIEVVLAGDAISQITDVDAGLVARVDDLRVGLAVEPASASVGEEVTVTATATVEGSAVVRGAQLVVTVPPALDLAVDVDRRDAAGEGWTCTVAGGVATCTAAETLLPGETTLPVMVTATAVAVAADAEIRAEVSFLDGTADDDAPDDVAVAVVDVTAAPTDPGPPGVPGVPGDPSDPAGPGSGPGSAGPLARTGTALLPTAVIGLGLLLGGLVLQRRRRPA